VQHEPENHDRGLNFDIATLLSRRRALGLLAGTGVVALVGCGSSDDNAASATSSSSSSSSGGSTSPSSSSSSSASSSSGAAASGTTEIPDETAGPFPGDGSNGPDVLTQNGIVRRDIRSSFGSASGLAAGVPLTLQLTVLDPNGGAARPGAALYVWHCDRDGRYSLYSEGVTDENYLRGVQEAGADGKVTFTTIFPGAYPGRWPHIHFEVYPSLDTATSGGSPSKTSQLALPEDACNTVYATAGYEQSVPNLAQLSLETDGVFSDGYAAQLATVTGTVANGLTASLNVGV
jgi:protocatechuate 3,4-dioxygenase beta subunit